MYGGMREYIGWSYGRLRMQGDMIFRSACKTQWSLQLSNIRHLCKPLQIRAYQILSLSLHYNSNKIGGDRLTETLTHCDVYQLNLLY